MNADAKRTRVLIIGAGFAGLHCARELASHDDFEITLIDRHNYQQFQPLLYQVATGALSPDNAAFNLRDVFRSHPNVTIRMCEVESVDLSAKTARTKDGETLAGDFLVLAAGAQANFFGTPGAEKLSYPMYSLRDAERIRARLLELLEATLKPESTDADSLKVVVVGGGATGVETAGAIADIMERAVKEMYRGLDPSRLSVTIVDRGKQVLGPFTEKSKNYATEILQHRGVTLKMDSSVAEILESGVKLADGTVLPASIIIWAGGLMASELSKSMGLTPGHGQRIDVEDDLSIKDHPGAYALGDFANIPGADGKPLPQLGSVAQQAGVHCAKNILAAVQNEQPSPFAYRDKGIMAMIGRNAAVAEVGEGHHALTGAIAFAAWLGVHALLLTTARAKLGAFFEWAWEYFGKVNVDAILDQPSASWAPDKGES